MGQGGQLFNDKRHIMFCGENIFCVQRIQNIMLHILNIYNAVNQH